ncbi:hypothetical protein KEU06_09220 [Pseudaminobacter sp. 19-2017]|uniref:Uncharacterized protein n=1 Tax=Pseudaminobacter soli (ex Zhang et al. 2022) TaxID=2831468 RepID=A0A942I2R1_9HYPH|nr:hypothetical protein [Pseudaminobacter soli]MBS3648784.1 hypothetical protein [Pseudaminobacter soli]
MQLPIDVARQAPFKKPKYIDEETPMLSRWMVFGFRPEDQHKPYAHQRVDVTDPNGSDIFTNVTGKQADAILKARNDFVDAILKIINHRVPEAWRVGMRVEYIRQISWGPSTGDKGTIVEVNGVNDFIVMPDENESHRFYTTTDDVTWLPDD